ncbi:MAG: amidohydrolase [Deltaproteobacteria bacterium]|nr:amidohydrolase [Deltaproteobacteria bacterium]
MKSASFVFVLLVAALPALAAPRIIVKNGRITGARGADTLVIEGGVITAVGKGFQLPPGSSSEADVVVDARGGVVVPGFHDSHIHMQGGGLSLVRAALAPAKTMGELQKIVKDYATAHPDRPWVLGRGWAYSLVPGGMPTAAQLDAAVADRPVFLRAYDGHTGWANTKALQLAGITKDTKDPADGEIVRDKKGNPTGALKEGAQDLMEPVLPKPTREEKKAALLAAALHCRELGLTAVDDIVADDDAFALWSELESEGLLPLRVKISPPLEGNLDTYAMWRDKLRSNRLVSFGFLKGFVDGVVESKTALMTEPFMGAKGAAGAAGDVGRPLIEQSLLFAMVEAAHARGFQVGLHSIGDGAVRLSLDAFESAQKKHPDVGVRHRVEHIEVLHKADAARFKALDVVASMQPFHANPFGNEPETGPWAENLGSARWPMTMPWRSVLAAGGALTFGSDWPVYTANPLHGFAVAISRRDETGVPKAGWTVHQIVTPEEAMNAYALERGDLDGAARDLGTLRPGQKADVVVLDPTVRLDDAASLWQGKVSAVIVDGVVVK